MVGDWKTAKDIIDKDQNAKTKILSPIRLRLTALHVAASCGRSEFVVELVKLLTPQELEIRDDWGRTALHYVALAAGVKAAKAMVEKNPNLPQLGDTDLRTPLFYAAKWRHQSKGKEMLKYLYHETKDEPPCHAFTSSLAKSLIVAITASGFYDIALRILRDYPKLSYGKNSKGTSILHVLAMQPSAFRSGNKLSLWNSLIYQFVEKEVTNDEANINGLGHIKRASAAIVHQLSNFIPGKRKVSEVKRRNLRAVTLVQFVCDELQKESVKFIKDFFLPPDGKAAILHLATEHGVFEVVQICSKYFPDLIWSADVKNRLLSHIAIEYRQPDIFNHIIDLIGENTEGYAEIRVDKDGNNALHVAAKLARSLQFQSVPGSAFQMLRELQWFKVVESLVFNQSIMEKNKNQQTPGELFITEHARLLKNAKDWMKDTSNSCMVVAALVATVAFAAMITVPGGYDSYKGFPILSKKKLFIAFSISNTLSMISSTASLLMFLSVHTSQYREEDFLDSLLKFLHKGLIFLYVAVAAMMISFCTGIGLSLQKGMNWVYIPIMIVACSPAIILTRSQLHLILLMATPFTSTPFGIGGQRARKVCGLNKIGNRGVDK